MSKNKNKVAIVTGGVQGIGRGITERLIHDGFKIVIGDYSADTDKAVQALKKEGADVAGIQVDTAKKSDVQKLVDFAVKTFGHLDVMVNNAGVVLTASVDDTKESDLERLYQINVYGVIYGIQAAVAVMRNNPIKEGSELRGKIINACSIAGHKGFALLSAYSGTKFAVRGITQAAAQEYAKDKITINNYCPGIVGTDMWKKIDADLAKYLGTTPDGAAFKKYTELVSLGRGSVPADLGKVVSFLASPDSDYMTGQSIIHDGGIFFN